LDLQADGRAYILVILESFLAIGLGREIDISEFLLLLLDHVIGDLDIGDLLVSFFQSSAADNSPWSSG
jgi:hypothetical protein